MKQFLLRLVILAGISFLPTVSNAQLREKAEELLSTTLGNDPEEPVTPTDTLSLDEQHRQPLFANKFLQDFHQYFALQRCGSFVEHDAGDGARGAR